MVKKYDSTVLPRFDNYESDVTQLIKDGKIAEAYLAVCTGAKCTDYEFALLKDIVENGRPYPSKIS